MVNGCIFVYSLFARESANHHEDWPATIWMFDPIVIIFLVRTEKDTITLFNPHESNVQNGLTVGF